MARSEKGLGMGSVQLLTLAVIFVGLAILFWGYTLLLNTPQHHFTIMISSSGTVTASPAQAQVYLFANATGNTSASAVANLSSITGAINATIMPLAGYNGSRIQTTSYNVYAPGPCYNYTSPYYYPGRYCRPALSPIFFVATESVTITLPDVNRINDALTGLSQVQGVSINNVAAVLSQQQQTLLGQQALSLALSNATAQAEALTNGARLTVQNITINYGGIYYPFAYGGSVANGKSSYNQTFFSGTATVTKSISAVFRVN